MWKYPEQCPTELKHVENCEGRVYFLERSFLGSVFEWSDSTLNAESRDQCVERNPNCKSQRKSQNTAVNKLFYFKLILNPTMANTVVNGVRCLFETCLMVG